MLFPVHMALCNSLSLASLCSTKCIFLPFFTPLLFLLCHFPVATVTDVGWFYLFLPFLCYLGGVQLYPIILFHLFSTGLALNLGMIKALKMSMDRESLLSRGLYLHIAIFLNKILPERFFFPHLQVKVLIESQSKLIDMWWFLNEEGRLLRRSVWRF